MNEKERNIMARIIKTIILAGVFALFGRMVAESIGDTQTPYVWMIYFACLPFGWRWASKVITATSLWGIVIKAVWSVALGMIALPVVVIGDIIALIGGIKKRKAAKQGR